MGFLLFVGLLVMAILAAAFVIGVPLGLVGGAVAAWKAGGFQRGVVAFIFFLGLVCWMVSNLAAGGAVAARQRFWIDLLFIVGLALAIRVRRGV